MLPIVTQPGFNIKFNLAFRRVKAMNKLLMLLLVMLAVRLQAIWVPFDESTIDRIFKNSKIDLTKVRTF